MTSINIALNWQMEARCTFTGRWVI